MSTRWYPPLVIAALGLLFFSDLVAHPTQVLYSDYSDILAEHLPAKRFLVRSWQETGEIPLWCPYSYGGAPLLHDIQVAAFYPPHLILYLLPEERLGAALSWLVVLHVIVAGWCMYAYARRNELGVIASLVAALGYMFAGEWLLHLLAGGHYITIGLAWLPLVLLALEQAMRRHSLLAATWAGVVFGVLALGTHPQWTLYAGLLVALWTLGTVLEEAGCLGGAGPRSWLRTVAALGRWAGYGAWAVLIAVALAAVQLLPTLEAASQSTRGVVGVDSGEIIEGGMRTLLFLFGPALTRTPPTLIWEDRGGLGVLWVAAAVLAPLLCRGPVRYRAVVCLILFLFALGGAVAVQWLPGFRLFRQPARMLVVATLPLAYLAGAATEALVAGRGLAPAERWRCRRILLCVASGFFILAGGFALRLRLEGKEIAFDFYWLTLFATLPAAYWLLGRQPVRRPLLLTLTWVALLATDLWGIAWPLVAVRPEEEIYARSACVRYLEEKSTDHWRVLDRDTTGATGGTPLGAGAPLRALGHIEALRGYNPLDVLRYKEYLQFITDQDEPLRPLAGALMFPVIGNFPIENKSLLDLLGTRYLLQPSDAPLEQAAWRKVYEDPQPTGYDFTTCGVRSLPAYTVYENPEALPRAFVVPHAMPLSDRSRALEALKGNDFRKQALLEGYEPAGAIEPPGGEYHQARIRQYLPNRVVVEVSGAAGYLVLTDVWFPGWTCRVDGREVPLYRADFLFRGVVLPEGAREVVFTFAPESYRWGKCISLTALALIAVLSSGAWVRRAPRQMC